MTAGQSPVYPPYDSPIKEQPAPIFDGKSDGTGKAIWSPGHELENSDRTSRQRMKSRQRSLALYHDGGAS